jgi:hypothetical protein
LLRAPAVQGFLQALPEGRAVRRGSLGQPPASEPGDEFLDGVGPEVGGDPFVRPAAAVQADGTRRVEPDDLDSGERRNRLYWLALDNANGCPGSIPVGMEKRLLSRRL